MQPAKVYLERVLREADTLGSSQSARASALNLTRSALRLAAQVSNAMVFLYPSPCWRQSVAMQRCIMCEAEVCIQQHCAAA